jgi:hypothetical protein
MCSKGDSNVTNLSKVLPHFLFLVALGFPLLANDLRDVRIVESWITTDDGLLVVLPIKDKRYKGVSGR